MGMANKLDPIVNILDAIDGINRIIEMEKNTTYNIGNNNDPISVVDLANKMVNLQKKILRLRKLLLKKAIGAPKEKFYKDSLIFLK